MKHDPALIESRRAAEARQAHPHGRNRRVTVFPAAFAASGGTYQRLVPCGPARRRDDDLKVEAP